MRVIDIGKEFSSSLVNRNSQQRDGKFSGEEFKDKYLSELMNPNYWGYVNMRTKQKIGLKDYKPKNK